MVSRAKSPRKSLPGQRPHLHVMNTYARNYRMRYCTVRGCKYREDWDEAHYLFAPYVYNPDPAKRGYRKPEPRIVPVDLWTGAEVTPL